MTTPAHNREKPCILIIDDEPQIRHFLRISLKTEGYELLEAENGEAGLGLCARHSPDLVILDLGLPDMDGSEVLAGLREWSSAPVIILSVRDRELEKVKALILARTTTSQNRLASMSSLHEFEPSCAYTRKEKAQ